MKISEFNVLGLIIIPLFFCATVLGACSDDDTTATTPDAQVEESWLFVQTAPSGTLTSNAAAQTSGGVAASEEVEYTLTLIDVDSDMIAFSDRPYRDVKNLTVSEFVSRWDSYGFNDVPPNAALELMEPQGDIDVVIVELFDPVYDGSSLSYTVVPLSDEESFLESHDDRVDSIGEMPSEFDDVTLFIDSADSTSDSCELITQPGCSDYLYGCYYFESVPSSEDSDPLDLSTFQTDVNEWLDTNLPGLQIEDTSPVIIEAFGGEGHKGENEKDSKYSTGGAGGAAGYAATVFTFQDLENLSNDLYLYVGINGPVHQAGGSSSIVTTASLVTGTPALDDVVVLAGGGGGGGKGAHAALESDSKHGTNGGQGGVAQNEDSEALLGLGSDSSGDHGDHKGRGGSRTTEDAGKGGSSGECAGCDDDRDSHNGGDGVGGFSTYKDSNNLENFVTFNDSNVNGLLGTFTSGEGGYGARWGDSGSGGGGYGGGGGGGYHKSDDGAKHQYYGGGGGGSYAKGSTVDNTDAIAAYKCSYGSKNNKGAPFISFTYILKSSD